MHEFSNPQNPCHHSIFLPLSMERSTSSTRSIGLHQNVDACVSLAKDLSTLLGPKSMEKLIVDFDGTYVITNDGATAASRMQIRNPAARLLVEMSHTMDENYGDGTTSVTLLACSILECLLPIATRPNGIKDITAHIMGLKPLVKEWIQRCAKAIDGEESSTIARKLCETTLSSKLASTTTPHISNMAVDFARSLFARCDTQTPRDDLCNPFKSSNSATINQEWIPIITLDGSNTDYSHVYKGFAFTAEHSLFCNNSKSLHPVEDTFLIQKYTLIGHIHQPKSIALRFPFTPQQTRSRHSTSAVISLDAIDRQIKEQESRIKKIVAMIKRTGATLVFIVVEISKGSTEDYFPDFAQTLMQRMGMSVMVIPSLIYDKIDFEEDNAYVLTSMLTFIFAGKIISKNVQMPEFTSFEDLEASKTPSCQLDGFVALRHHGTAFYILQAPNIDLLSAFLHAPSPTILEETHRSFIDAISVCKGFFQTPRIVPGGGAVEFHIASQLEDLDPADLIYSSLAQAFLRLPMQLCINAGMNPHETLSLLRVEGEQMEMTTPSKIQSHHQKVFLGIDCRTKSIVDPLLCGIYELESNKIGQVLLALECALAVFKIDEVISIDDVVL